MKEISFTAQIPHKIRTMIKSPVWQLDERHFQTQFLDLRKRVEIQRKTNGLRHAFCTFHYALHQNENLTASQAGNSPAMIHAHYKGLSSQGEAPIR